MKQKNILIVAPPFIPTSKDSVAGIEQMVYSLGRALVEKGHRVFTAAKEDSQVYGELVPTGFKDIEIYPGAELEHFHQIMAYQTSVLRQFLRQTSGLDVIIDRCEGISLSLTIEENGPLVICGLDMESKFFLNPRIFETLKPQLARRKDCFAAVAKHVAEEYRKRLSLGAELSQRMHVVYNGIVTNDFEFSNSPGEYLLYLGRIRRGKAPHLAIRAAIETGNKIVIAGGNIPQNTDGQYEDREYFESEIRLLLGQQIEFVGPVGLKQKIALMKRAKVLLFPSQHKEAQPLVPLEAMACGTPVIAFNHSGAREEIIHGETGFLVDSYEEMVDSIKRIGELDKRKCRDHVCKKFDYKRMGMEYLNIIQDIN